MSVSFRRMRTVLKYPGAKNRLASWICSYIPDHEVYLEPYFGSGAVLFNKPRSHIETVNDLNGEVVNFFEILRDRSEELIKAIKYTPFAREEYDKSYQKTSNKLEKARRFYVRCWQGFGCANLYHNGFKSGQQSNSPNPAVGFAKSYETLEMAAERLKGVQIEKLDALELLNRYDTEDVFVYLDPPYLLETRKSNLYKHEMSDEQHIELLELITKHPGRIMISGYDNDLYSSYLKDWRKVKKDTLAENGLKRTETLWMNYKSNQLEITDIFKG